VVVRTDTSAQLSQVARTAHDVYALKEQLASICTSVLQMKTDDFPVLENLPHN
jgi:hypothetical protein